MVLHVVPSSGEAHEASERTERVRIVCGPMRERERERALLGVLSLERETFLKHNTVK
jgi:hypothetical protein